MVILDTNIIIDHLRQSEGADTAFRSIPRRIAKEDLAISVVTVQELYEGRSTREKKKEDALVATIAPLRVLPYAYDLAQAAGELARELDHPLDCADAAIAATALALGAQLATLDRKSFAGIPQLELANV